jgi:hypothetical protein
LPGNFFSKASGGGKTGVRSQEPGARSQFKRILGENIGIASFGLRILEENERRSRILQLLLPEPDAAVQLGLTRFGRSGREAPAQAELRLTAPGQFIQGKP